MGKMAFEFEKKIDDKLDKIKKQINDLQVKEKELEKEKKAKLKARQEKIFMEVGKEFFKMGFVSKEMAIKFKNEFDNDGKCRNWINKILQK